MDLKIIFRFLLVVFMPVFIMASPLPVSAQNKCGVNLSVYYDEIIKASGLVKTGGWAVGIGNVMDGISLQEFFKHDLNVVIRGHAGWTVPLQEKTDWLDKYALSWVATMAIMDTNNQPIFFMPLNEPNQKDLQNNPSSDYLSEANVVYYINRLKAHLSDFYAGDLLPDSKIRLLSPMINQTHPKFPEYLQELNRLVGGDFYSLFSDGVSQNLYDSRDCTNPQPFCDPRPRFNAAKYNEVINHNIHFGVETGISSSKDQYPPYHDTDLARLVSAGLSGPWQNGNFRMFAIFSHDPHRNDWDIFSSASTQDAYHNLCQEGSVEKGNYPATDKDKIKTKYPQLQECENGALVADLSFCVAAGSGGTSEDDPKPYQGSRFIKTKQVAESLSDPVIFRQSDKLAVGEEKKPGNWGADFRMFDKISIPWAQAITKYLAGPFVYDGNTAIRDLLDSEKLVDFRPLTDLTPKYIQDGLRAKYWEACGITDPCNGDLHCHGSAPGITSVIDLECCPDPPSCKEKYTPCVGFQSNECLLSNGLEIRENVLTLPPSLDPAKAEENANKSQKELIDLDEKWEKISSQGETNSHWWSEIPLYANPLALVKGGIRMESCNGRSGTGVTTYTPWVAALNNVSDFLNTMLSPSDAKGKRQRPLPDVPVTMPDSPIELGEGSWNQGEGTETPDDLSDDVYCSDGLEAAKIISTETPGCFNYHATIQMADLAYGGGLLFRINYKEVDDYHDYTGYGFHIKDRGDGFEWTLKKTQDDNYCKIDCRGGTGRCFCFDNQEYTSAFTPQSTGQGCNCNNIINKHALDNPMNLLALQDYEASIRLDKSQPHDLEVSVCDDAQGTKTTISASIDGTPYVSNYEDKYHPYARAESGGTDWRGLGISVYNGDRVGAYAPEDLAVCFSDIGMTGWYQLAFVLQQSKASFVASAVDLIKNDWNSLKNKGADIKTKTVNAVQKPINLAKSTWRENNDLPNYQKIEKVLLASRRLFQPNSNLIAQAPAFDTNCLKLWFDFYDSLSENAGKYYVKYKFYAQQTNAEITGHMGDIDFNGPGGSGCGNQQIPPLPDSFFYESGQNPCFPDKETTDGSFSLSASIASGNWDGRCTTIQSVSVTCTGKYDLATKKLESFSCSSGGGVIPGLPGQTACVPPAQPTFKPDGPEDPVVAEGHTIFGMGKYNLQGTWETVCHTDTDGKQHCTDRCKNTGMDGCDDSIEKPIWAIVKYPFLQQAYDNLSNMKNGLMAKFWAVSGNAEQPKDWDVAGESDIQYCTKSMEEVKREAAAAGEDISQWEGYWPDPALYPYPGRNPQTLASFPGNAVCTDHTEGLKAYPKYIDGMANATGWLICALNPAGSDCSKWIEEGWQSPDTQTECLPYSHFCPDTTIKIGDPNDEILLNDVPAKVKENSKWAQYTHVDAVIDASFIDLAKQEWQKDLDSLEDKNSVLYLNMYRFKNEEIDTYLGQRWLDFVIGSAKARGWSPRLVTTLWIEESAASAYGMDNKVLEDLGCGGIKENLPGNLTCLFTGFDKYRQSNDYEKFLLQYKSYSWLNQGCFEYPVDTPTDETFPGRVCHWYDILGGK